MDKAANRAPAGAGGAHPPAADSSGGRYLHGVEFLYVEPLPGVQEFTVKGEGYSINDFLQHYDWDFVRSAYLGILGREPDAGGLGFYLAALRNGDLTKCEILMRLRYSGEGRARGVKIRFLYLHYLVHLLCKVPLLGYLVRLAMGLLRLPVIVKNLYNLDAYVHNHFIQLHEYLNRTTGSLQLHVNNMLEDFTVALETLANMKADAAALASLASKNDMKSTSERLLSKVEEISTLGSNLGVLKETLAAISESEPIQEILGQKVNVEEFRQLERLTSERIERLAADKAALDAEFRRLEAFTVEQIERLSAGKADMNCVTQTVADFNALKELVSAKADRQEFESKLAHKIDQHEFSSLATKFAYIRQALLENERRLSLFLEEARQRLPEKFTERQIRKLTSEQDPFLDAMYVAFEDQFRGTRQEIKERLRVYIPYILKADAGNSEFPVVDLGCGRGEWLEVLKQNGLVALGVDRNRIMLQQCKDLDLEVVGDDLVEFLRRQKANSFGAITGHQIIEHLDMTDLIALLDESLRTLRSGGMIVFESPNPENLLVGAYTFYFDPSHKTPLVPETMKFIAEQRGFINIQILRLNRYSDICQIKDDDEFKNKWFYSEMDFAIIGYKP